MKTHLSRSAIFLGKQFRGDVEMNAQMESPEELRFFVRWLRGSLSLFFRRPWGVGILARLTAGTVMERTHTPLSVWFSAVSLLSAKRRICRLSSSSGNSDCRATRTPTRFSTNSGLAWFAPTRTGSAASLAKSLRPMKPVWADAHAARGAASKTWCSWLVPSKFASASVPAASTNRRMVGMHAVFDLP